MSFIENGHNSIKFNYKFALFKEGYIVGGGDEIGLLLCVNRHSRFEDPITLQNTQYYWAREEGRDSNTESRGLKITLKQLTLINLPK